MDITMEFLKPTKYVEGSARVKELRASGELNDKDMESVLKSSEKAVADDDIHWRNYGESPLRLGQGTYMVAALHGRGMADDDSSPRCRGVIGVVLSEVDLEKQEVQYFAARRTKQPGQEAVYTYANGKDGEPQAYPRFSQAQMVLERNVSHIVATHYANELVLEKQKQAELAKKAPEPEKEKVKDIWEVSYMTDKKSHEKLES